MKSHSESRAIPPNLVRRAQRLRCQRIIRNIFLLAFILALFQFILWPNSSNRSLSQRSRRSLLSLSAISNNSSVYTENDKTTAPLSRNLQPFESSFRTSYFKTEADVPGANMDHRGSILNPCLTDRSLLRRAILEEPISPYQPAGISYFVRLHGHRVDASSFAVTGLTALSLHDPDKAEGCMWLAHDSSTIPGRVYSVYPGEHHDLTYESIIIHCQLDYGTKQGLGGALFLTLDGETFEAYNEADPLPQLAPGTSLKHNIGFCSFPIYRDIVPERIAEWVQYMYHAMEVDYFILNDGGSIDDNAYKVLKPFVRAGWMEINDIRGGYRFESKHNVLLLNDCIYRMRWLAHWSLVLDFDEFLYLPPPLSLPSLLSQHAGRPWLTFGSLWWGVHICRTDESSREWPMERMVFHWPEYYCVNQERGYTQFDCVNYHGHRKYIYDPRQVSTVEVHRPVEPIDGGVNLNASVAWVNHFQGVLRSSTPQCNESYVWGKAPEWWVEDAYLAKAMRVSRERGLRSRRKAWG